MGHLLLWLTAFGALQAAAGLLAVRGFAARSPLPPKSRPAVTILKPVCGFEPRLEEAIASFCTQAYGAYQLVIGAQDPDDPALVVARRVKARFPQADIAIVVNPARHGVNRKISNLINMMPFAAHDVLVIADSDLHVRADYLDSVVATLQLPGTGLVTTLASGEPAAPGIAARLGALHMSHIFLPSALIGEAIGRQDCLGGTMALRRDTLARIGGLHALVGHLADDNVLGTLVRRLGLAVRIADTLPAVTVQECRLRALWQHELRWARTIRALTPGIFAITVLQYPLAWSLLWLVLAHSGSALLCFGCAWAIRAAVTLGIDDALASLRPLPTRRAALWLLPLRDLLSVAEVIASYFDDTVVWRGEALLADAGIVREPRAEEPAAIIYSNG
jgi:ceramide glucosyltransferase